MVQCVERGTHEDHGALEKSFLVDCGSLQERTSYAGPDSSDIRQGPAPWREWLVRHTAGMGWASEAWFQALHHAETPSHPCGCLWMRIVRRDQRRSWPRAARASASGSRQAHCVRRGPFLVRIRIHFYSKPVTWLFGPLHARAMRPRASKCVNRACEVMLVVW